MSEQLAKSHYLRALQFWKIGDLDQAESQAKQVLTYQPHHEGALLVLGNVSFKKKAYHISEQYFTKVLKSNPKNVEALTNFGLVLLAEGRLAEADEVFRKALDIEGADRVDLYFHLGNIAKVQKKLSEAMQYYHRALEIEPGATHVTLALIQLLEAQGEHALVETMVQEGLKHDRQNPYLLNYQGLYALRRGDYEGAVSAFGSALRLKPDWSQALNNLGLAYFHLGRFPEAQRIYRDLIRLDPEDLEAKINLATILARSGNVAEAESLLLQVLEKNFRQPRAIQLLASLHHQRNDTKRAVEILDRYLAYDPDSPDIRRESGRYRYILGDLERAEQDILIALNHRGDDTEVLRILANIYLRTDRADRVEKVLTRLRRVAPNDLEIYKDIARFHRERRRNREALQALERYLAKYPDDLESLTLAGEIHHEEGNHEQAIRIFERILELHPNDFTALTALNKIYQAIGRNDKALELSEKIIQMQGNQDFDRLIDTLDVYENAVHNVGRSADESWRRNLRTLVQPEEVSGVTAEAEVRAEPPEEEEWMFGPGDADGLSLLDMPDLNPAIVMDEEEQELRIVDEDELLHYDAGDDEEDPLVVNAGGGGANGGASSGGVGGGGPVGPSGFSGTAPSVAPGGSPIPAATAPSPVGGFPPSGSPSITPPVPIPNASPTDGASAVGPPSMSPPPTDRAPPPSSPPPVTLPPFTPPPLPAQPPLVPPPWTQGPASFAPPPPMPPPIPSRMPSSMPPPVYDASPNWGPPPTSPEPGWRPAAARPDPKPFGVSPPEPRLVPEPPAPEPSRPEGEPLPENKGTEAVIPEDLPPPVTNEDLEDGLDTLMKPNMGRGEAPPELGDGLFENEDSDIDLLEESLDDLERPWEEKTDSGSEEVRLEEEAEELGAEPKESRRGAPATHEGEGEEEPLFVDAFPDHFADDPLPAEPTVLDDLPPPDVPKTRAVVPTAERIAQLMDYLGSLANFLPPDKKLQLLNDHIPLKIERIKLNLKPVKSSANPQASEARRKVRELIDKVRGNLK